MGVFFRMWFCQTCGKDLCNICYEALVASRRDNASSCSTCHAQDDFLPLSFLSKKELQDALNQMRPLVLDPPTHVPPHTTPSAADIQRFQRGQLTKEQFAQLWADCQPFVLVGVSEAATPHELLDLNKNDPHPCMTTFYDDSTWFDQEESLEDYFDKWDSDRQRPLQIRVSHS